MYNGETGEAQHAVQPTKSAEASNVLAAGARRSARESAARDRNAIGGGRRARVMRVVVYQLLHLSETWRHREGGGYCVPAESVGLSPADR
jgi:hypothetical protein